MCRLYKISQKKSRTHGLKTHVESFKKEFPLINLNFSICQQRFNVLKTYLVKSTKTVSTYIQLSSLLYVSVKISAWQYMKNISTGSLLRKVHPRGISQQTVLTFMNTTFYLPCQNFSYLPFINDMVEKAIIFNRHFFVFWARCYLDNFPLPPSAITQ